ncbi:hypothetical protein SAMN04488104_101954 [Algoriphagus faecimaris]|uniref:Uncharacterized protein n=1 Tax=Algoriphagus faecimaris TaxID=686796 RepID=A0A1G6SXK6_9BACT|nr:hypothetical protein SAMN04488104_101954 [Algoriphagus faecimaris]
MRIFNSSKGLFSISALFCFFSCVQESETPVPPPPPVVFENLEGDLRFYTIPTSENSLSFDFDQLEDYQYKQVFLMQDSDTLATAGINDFVWVGTTRKRATFDFEFDKDAEYYFLVEVSDPGTPNTRYTYRMPEYQHVFESYFNFEVIAELDRTIDFDFSPSRDFLFISNFSGNEFKIHRLDLASKSLNTYFTDNEINGSLIRASSDEEFLYKEGSLRKMNITTKESTLIASSSNGIGQVSRVIENTVIVNNRFPNIYNHQAIDLTSGEAVSLGNFSRFVQEDNFDRHIIDGFEINPADLELVSLQTGDDGEQLAYYDQNGFTFLVKTDTERPFEDRVPYYSLIVKKDGVKVYETTEALKGYPFLFKKFNVEDNKFVFHKTFGSDTDYKIEGFYEVDLTSGAEQLIHVDVHPFTFLVFDFEDKGMYGKRGNQFMSITKK